MEDMEDMEDVENQGDITVVTSADDQLDHPVSAPESSEEIPGLQGGSEPQQRLPDKWRPSPSPRRTFN